MLLELLLVSFATAVQQAPATQPATAPSAEVVEYTGRQRFELMPPGAPILRARRAGALAEASRPDIPMFAAAVEPGQTVADVGCGKGRYSFRLAEATGEEGLVYCRDINERSLDRLREKLEEHSAANLDIAESEPGDVMLPEASIDVALLSDVYQFVLRQEKTKESFLDSLHTAMKPGGVVVVTNVTSHILSKPEDWQAAVEATVADFHRHGFETGRRYVFEEETRPVLVLEFRRPAM